MYKISIYVNQTGEEFTFIHRQNDNGTVSSFANSLENTDYQEYLKWLEEGNTPLPADEGNE